MSESTIKWYRTPLSRDTLRQLIKRRDGPALAQSLGFLLVYAGTAAGAWVAWDAVESGSFPVLGLVLLLFAHGTVANFLLQGFHELVHQTVFKTKWLGELFLYIISFLSFLNPFQFRASHKRHHLYTLHPPKDREVLLPIKITLLDYICVAIIDPWSVFFKIRMAATNATGQYNSQWEEDNFTEEGPKARRKLFWWARFNLLGHGLIVALAVAGGTPQLAVLITFGSFYGRWLQYLCNESQHVGLTDNIPDFRACCRTFTINPVVQFLYWHMNFHTEHHMYAAVPCYNLGKLHRAIRHELPSTKRGVVPTWLEITSIMQRQKREPDYKYMPPLPPKSSRPVAGSSGANAARDN